MIEKDKTYNYEELKEIICEAELKTLEILGEDFAKHGGEDLNSMSQLAFNLQNMLATSKMAKVLLGEDK